MPIWKLYKGESKTFEGTVLIATSAGMTPTNYDITGATLGFDIGSVMGNWMMRTDSLFGSLGKEILPFGDFSNGTYFVQHSSPVLATYRDAIPFATVLRISSASDAEFSTFVTGFGTVDTFTNATFVYSVFLKSYLNPMKFNGVDNFSGGTTFSGGLTLTREWKNYRGSLVTGVNSVQHWATLLFSVPSTGIHGAYIANVSFKEIVATSNFQIMTGSMGVYRYSFEPRDTENLAATSYYFDIWLRTPAEKEYILTVGTLQLLPTVGTF